MARSVATSPPTDGELDTGVDGRHGRGHSVVSMSMATPAMMRLAAALPLRAWALAAIVDLASNGIAQAEHGEHAQQGHAQGLHVAVGQHERNHGGQKQPAERDRESHHQAIRLP